MNPRRLLVEPWLWLPALLTLLLLAAAPLLGWQLRAKAPAVKLLDGLAVAAAETPAVLGWEELGQRPGPRSAAAHHLLVSRRGSHWVIANQSQDRRVFLRLDDDRSRYLQRWRIREGDAITLAEAAFEVVSLGPDRLVLRDSDSGREVAWDDGALVPKDEEVFTVCRSALSRLVQRARWRFRNVAGDDRPEFELFAIGGGLNCSNRWRHDALPPESVSVVWQAGGFWLAPGARRYDVLMSRAGSDRQLGFTQLTLPIRSAEARVESIVMGRTQYRVDVNADRFRLTPVANMDLWTDEEPEGSLESRDWVGAGLGPEPWLRLQGLLLLPGLAAMLAAVVVIVWYWRRRQYLGAWWLLRCTAAAAPGMLGGWLTVLLYRGAGPPDAMLLIGMVWLAWTWATLMMAVSGRLRGIGGWIWFAVVFLAGVGLLNLLQLGAGADNTRWLGFVLKHAVLLALFGWTVALMTVLSVDAWQRLWMWLFNAEGIAAGLAGVLVVLMMVQLALGSEEGIGGIQPVEVTKTVFVLLLAFVGMHFTEIRRRETQTYRRSRLRFLLPFLRFIAIFFVVLLSVVVGVRDFSPMVILSLVTLAWMWKAGRREAGGFDLWRLIRPAVVLAVAGLVAAGWWAYHNPEELPDGMPQHDRVLVWAEPVLHPHSGSQVLGAMDRVGEGGWFGEVAWFGENGKVVNLPAVQDDFITAFFLHRFGAVPGLALLAFQLLYLAGLFTLGLAIERSTAGGDYREQNAGLVLGFTLYGLACTQFAHWVIAWSNTLGLLPVMGQPMTWMSAGNSHLVGFALFGLAIALPTAWIVRAAR